MELTDADAGTDGTIERAAERTAEGDSFVPKQFENRSNVQSHRRTTGPELQEATDGDLDAVVAGVGTGGEHRPGGVTAHRTLCRTVR